MDSSAAERSDLTDTGVVTKYKSAAEICNNVLQQVRNKCTVGARIRDIASQGDELIEELCSRVYKGKAVEKGIAFPTCLSVNNCVGHYSPLDEDLTTLQEGDMLKIDLGVHIDGYVAVQATTVIIRQDDTVPVTGKAADVIKCAQTCFEAAMRLIRPGKYISEVAGPLNQIAETYGCSLVEGVMTHNMKQFVIDGNKCILNKPTADQKVEDAPIQEYEVYAIDIVVSSGDGKARVRDEKQTTVFKRALNVEYHLKLKTSRAILSEVNKRYPCMPFPLRQMLVESKTSKLGLVECLQHNLLQSYPVLWDRDGSLVAQVKGTVLLLPNGTDRITTGQAQAVDSQVEIKDSALLDLLASSVRTKKKTSSKRKTLRNSGAGEA